MIEYPVTNYPMDEDGNSALMVDANGIITVQKAKALGGVNEIGLTRDEALNLFAALREVLGHSAVGNYVPVWERLEGSN